MSGGYYTVMRLNVMLGFVLLFLPLWAIQKQLVTDSFSTFGFIQLTCINFKLTSLSKIFWYLKIPQFSHKPSNALH